MVARAGGRRRGEATKHAVPTVRRPYPPPPPPRPGPPQGGGPPAGRAPVPPASEAEVGRLNAKDVLGKHGEQLAAEFLQKAGFRILGRHWPCAEGEDDIVAVGRPALVACEGKTRSS